LVCGCGGVIYKARWLPFAALLSDVCGALLNNQLFDKEVISNKGSNNNKNLFQHVH